jgi:hypothetical protein
MKPFDLKPEKTPKILQITPAEGWILFRYDDGNEMWSWTPVGAFGLVKHRGEKKVVPLCDSGELGELVPQFLGFKVGAKIALRHWSTILDEWDPQDVEDWEKLETYTLSQYAEQKPASSEGTWLRRKRDRKKNQS